MIAALGPYSFPFVGFIDRFSCAKALTPQAISTATSDQQTFSHPSRMVSSAESGGPTDEGRGIPSFSLFLSQPYEQELTNSNYHHLDPFLRVFAWDVTNVLMARLTLHREGMLLLPEKAGAAKENFDINLNALPLYRYLR